MAVKKPNTLCKNRDCTKGADGGRKHYYSCRYCARTENWRSVACCWDCYVAYQEQVKEARSRGTEPDLLPDRTDMTKEEVKTLVVDTPLDLVVAQTAAELADEMEAHPTYGFAQIVDEINAELDQEEQAKPRKKKVGKKTEELP